MQLSRSIAARFSSLRISVPPGSYLAKEEVVIPFKVIFFFCLLSFGLQVKRVFDVAFSVKEFPADAKSSDLFVADLKFDSFLRKELNDKLADEFCVVLPNEIQDNIINIDSAVNYFASHPKAR